MHVTIMTSAYLLLGWRQSRGGDAKVLCVTMKYIHEHMSLMGISRKSTVTVLPDFLEMCAILQ